MNIEKKIALGCIN